jgi:hypothetical protein
MSEKHSSPKARRFGSDEAHSWARNLRLGNSHAKHILKALTLYVDGDGSCFVSVPQLALDCEIAPETVRRRLVWLESIGAIVRLPQWIHENGRRSGSPPGKRTSDEIRLLIMDDVEEIERRACGEDGTGAGQEDSELNQCDEPDSGIEVGHVPQPGLNDAVSHVPQPGLNNAQDSSRTLVGLYQDSNTVESTESRARDSNLNLNKKENPPTPLKRGGEHEIQFEDFSAAYPGPVIDVPKAEAFWRALTDPERAAALTGAKGYAAYIDAERSAGRNRAVKDAHRWLRDKLWIGFAKEGAKAETSAQQFTCTENSPEWLKWQVYYRCCGEDGIPEYRISRFEGRNAKLATVPRRWPPECGGFSGEPWQEHARGSRECAAWLARLRELPGARIVFRRVRVGGEMAVGLRVPSQWPPAKGSSVAPETLMDAEDAAAFGA